MDDAMIARLLQTYGAPATARNANAAREFFASNPEIAEKRAMGMRGSGLDDNSDIFAAQLDKFMQEAEAAAPPGKVEVGPIEQVAPPQAAPAQRAAPAKMSNMPTQPGQSRQAGYGPAPSSTAAAAGNKGDGSIWDWLLPVLVGTGAIYAGDKMTNRPQKAQPRAIDENGKLINEPFSDRPQTNAANADTTRAPAPYAEDTPKQRPTPTYKNEKSTTVPFEEPPTQSQADVERMKAEVEAENAAAKRLEDQIKRQVETKKLTDAAKRAVGRR